jgi:hypothetical protein
MVGPDRMGRPRYPSVGGAVDSAWVAAWVVEHETPEILLGSSTHPSTDCPFSAWVGSGPPLGGLPTRLRTDSGRSLNRRHCHPKEPSPCPPRSLSSKSPTFAVCFSPASTKLVASATAGSSLLLSIPRAVRLAFVFRPSSTTRRSTASSSPSVVVVLGELCRALSPTRAAEPLDAGSRSQPSAKQLRELRCSRDRGRVGRLSVGSFARRWCFRLDSRSEATR